MHMGGRMASRIACEWHWGGQCALQCCILRNSRRMHLPRYSVRPSAALPLFACALLDTLATRVELVLHGGPIRDRSGTSESSTYVSFEQTLKVDTGARQDGQTRTTQREAEVLLSLVPEPIPAIYAAPTEPLLKYLKERK